MARKIAMKNVRQLTDMDTYVGLAYSGAPVVSCEGTNYWYDGLTSKCYPYTGKVTGTPKDCVLALKAFMEETFLSQ